MKHDNIEKSSSKTSILCNGKEIVSLDSPLKKSLLWHITNKCNQTCLYCYGSFNGLSYKDTFNNKKEVPLENLLNTIDDLYKLGFQRAYICGGEPFLRKDIWQVLSKLAENEIESFVTSNMVFLDSEIERYFKLGIFTNLSISLDSINHEYNDFVRGNTITVISNIKRLIQLKKSFGVPTELGIHGVITKMNIGYLDELIDWAVSIGLDYISLQLVYLPKWHKYYRQLAVTNDYSEILAPIFEHLNSTKHSCRVPGKLFLELSKHFLSGKKMLAYNCFCENNNFLFIDGLGNVRCCPSKHSNPSGILGNICQMRLNEIEIKSGDTICRDMSLDCLCVWEMGYPLTFEIRL